MIELSWMSGTAPRLLLLLVASNAAPVLATWALQRRWAWPLDLGWRLPDRQPLFGSAKTWRGVFAALLSAWGLAVLLGFGSVFGVVFGLLVVAGDLFSSFAKRRMGMAPSSRCLGLDQLPESFLPCGYAVVVLRMDWWWALLLPLAFMLIEILVSKPLFLLNIRQRPY